MVANEPVLVPVDAAEVDVLDGVELLDLLEVAEADLMAVANVTTAVSVEEADATSSQSLFFPAFSAPELPPKA